MLDVAIFVIYRVLTVQAEIKDRVEEGALVWQKIEQYAEEFGRPPGTLQELHQARPLTGKQVALFSMALGNMDWSDHSSYHYDPESGAATLTYSSWFWSNQSRIVQVADAKRE